MNKGLTIFFIAFLITMIGVPFFIKLDKWIGLVDNVRADGPSNHKSKKGTPTMGGVVIYIAILITMLWQAKKDPFIVFVLVTTFLFGAVGFLDDWLAYKRKTSLGLKAREKIIIQFSIAIIAGLGLWYLGIARDVRFFSLNISNLYLYLLWVAVVIIATSNAVNLTDGVDGLAGGIFFIASLTYGLIGYIRGSDSVAFLSLACCGACVGFLWYNFYPAKIFMGDVGALGLGSLLALQALHTRTEFLLLMIGGIFVLEALSVIAQVIYFKISKGKRLLKMSPLHHHFELLGWSEPQIVIRFMIINSILALGALWIFVNKF